MWKKNEHRCAKTWKHIDIFPLVLNFGTFMTRLTYSCLLFNTESPLALKYHDDVIKWKHFARNLAFVRGIHRWPVDSSHKGQWRWALMFSLICEWTNGWANNHQDAGYLRRHRAHYDVTVMMLGMCLRRLATVTPGKDESDMTPVKNVRWFW